jgi:hypothetical protein
MKEEEATNEELRKDEIHNAESDDDGFEDEPPMEELDINNYI